LNTGNDKVMKPETYRAAGSCRFSNPYIGPSTVSCHADTEKGEFEGVFISNGQPPDVSRSAGGSQENEAAAPIVAADGVVLKKLAIANWIISAKKRGNVFDAKRFAATFEAANQLLDQKMRNCLYKVEVSGNPDVEPLQVCNVPEAETLKYAASLYVAALHMALNPPW
jgi:hypothetical protein